MECWHLILQIYKLPQSSLAELARNSVRQSGFEMEIKRHWLGNEWYLPGAAGNDINKVHVCLSFDSPSLQTRLNTFNVDKRSRYQAGLSTPDVGGRTWYDTRKSLKRDSRGVMVTRRYMWSRAVCCEDDLRFTLLCLHTYSTNSCPSKFRPFSFQSGPSLHLHYNMINCGSYTEFVVFHQSTRGSSRGQIWSPDRQFSKYMNVVIVTD